MVRGAEDQFAYQIEKLRAENNFEGGNVIKKYIESEDPTRDDGLYAYLISPQSQGGTEYLLGKYKKEIDLDERADMDYKRLLFRFRELGEWYILRQLEDSDIPITYTYSVPLEPMKEAKSKDEGYHEAFKDMLFGRSSFECNHRQQQLLTIKLLYHLQLEINQLHLEDNETTIDISLLVEKLDEWGKIPSNYDTYITAIESGDKPQFIN